MTDEIVTEPIVTSAQATVESVAEKRDFKSTIFKSAYYHGQHMLNFFLNFDTPQAPGAFSILIKKGKFVSVYNLTPMEKVSFAKAVIAQLTPEEIHSLIG